ncbi:uncharacterized protein PAC_17813 [Phialocephala subalpina]|uniref:C2H2-type domain-containing protein n=1 Tax=Phialocephala subalpina TaxID=576137 RepID=A0A1L7XS93_9HELO|nr:uncharacterized protein PAC_17813 [Phialocephala subalpina]
MAFQCRFCPRTFALEKHLTDHLAAKGDHVLCTHNGCSKTFKSRDKMQNHLKKDHRATRPAYVPLSISEKVEIGTKIDRPRVTTTTMSLPSGNSLTATKIATKIPQNQVNSGRMSHNPPITQTKVQDPRWSIIPPPQHHEAITKLRQRTHTWEVLDLHVQSRNRKENSADYEPAPAASLLLPKRAAVALDCEMVGAREGEKEHNVLARLSVIDYLTGDVLIDSLVNPDKQVTDWRTRWSGVTRGAMNTAIRNGNALKGYKGAREELWKHIDSSTVIVGQALKNDFDVLRITHSLVVDSGIVTAEAAGIPSISLYGIKTACTELLRIKVQQGRGHDSVEDSLAAREVVLTCLNDPERLEQWAKIKREEYAIAEEKRKLKVEKERAERRAALDKKISWTREEWPGVLTKEEQSKIRVKIPRLGPTASWDFYLGPTRVPATATWATTISRSREEWIDGSRIVRVVLGPSRGLAEEYTGELGQWVLYDADFQHVVVPQTSEHSLSDADREDSELFVGLLAQVPEMILDQPLDESEDSLLMEALQPSSPELEMEDIGGVAL